MSAEAKKRKRDAPQAADGLDSCDFIKLAGREIGKALEKARDERERREQLAEENRSLGAKLHEREADIANLCDEIGALRKEVARLERVIEFLRPVSEAAVQMKDIASGIVSTYNKSVENQGACVICGMDEVLILLDNGVLGRYKCPKCDRVNACCSECLGKWRDDPRAPGLCFNRGHCDQKLV
jgi:hypothetical protein